MVPAAPVMPKELFGRAHDGFKDIAEILRFEPDGWKSITANQHYIELEWPLKIMAIKSL